MAHTPRPPKDPRPLTVASALDAAAAREFRDRGYCPVECAYGEESVIDDLAMDHHGPLAALEPVSVRAWRDHHGARARDPRFVVAGKVDADAAMAIAALAGTVPGPDTAGSGPVADLVELIGLLDVDPIGRDITTSPAGGLLRLWSTLFAPTAPTGNLAAIHAWTALCTRDPEALAPYTEVAVLRERERRDRAAAEARRCRRDLAVDDRLLVLDGPTVWGFDVWYGRRVSHPADAPSGWEHPVVLSRHTDGRASLGCPNTAVAQALFGNGGLRAVFPRLAPPGWGGRDAIGGSPRHEALTDAGFIDAARAISYILAGGDTTADR